jgi:endonuclease/exonuclease/phosphatase family metal-dependent hydrolase
VKTIALCLAAILLSVVPGGAALLLDDSFDYANGPLVTVSGGAWLHHSGSVTGEVAVASGRALLNETNNEDVNAPLAGQPYPASGATNVFYASFTVRFSKPPSGSGAYFAHFKDSSSGYRARIWALTGGALPDKFHLGISSTSGSAISATNPTQLSLATGYTVVVRLVNSNSVGTLWVNPDSESAAGVSTTESASTFTVVSFALRENTGEGALSVDDLKVGTTFDEVLPDGPIGEAPAIVSQPQNQIVTNGADVTFTASASGTPPPGFQWQFTPASDVRVPGADLPGAASSNLTLSAVSFGQAGFYTVTVSNAAGTAVSQPFALSVWSAAAPKFSYLTYNAAGNGLTNWSTNMWHVQAIGRQVQYLDPDIITFQEIPVTNNCTAQMFDFVAAFRPGYYLVTNSQSDGFIHSVILSRFPILASVSRLHGSDLAPYGYTGSGFTRDLFEAQISVPGFPEPLHVFTVHLKSGQDNDSGAKRAAEAAAVSNYFATVFLPAGGQQPYVLSGDLNEDILLPPASNPQSIQRLTSGPTGLRLATVINPLTASEQTWSIRNDSLSKRYDYILPCGSLYSNVVNSQVFRTDLLVPPPPNLYSNDDKTASDHLPVLMTFANPFNTPFRLLSFGLTNQTVTLGWESQNNRVFNVEVSTDLMTWTLMATNITTTATKATFTTNLTAGPQFFRMYRVP